ncbi:hypothetical protein NDU88_002767 [Pleurodeles waltl]|uniref:Uncharacterized protein n=1 Tax=Pleurodeles waltl TaxID=8319 RepID=A0AAV7MNP6_PLEWA|nr:hypothetical protein NDU88_002767 [Pleurodeles waltl]
MQRGPRSAAYSHHMPRSSLSAAGPPRISLVYGRASSKLLAVFDHSPAPEAGPRNLRHRTVRQDPTTACHRFQADVGSDSSRSPAPPECRHQPQPTTPICAPLPRAEMSGPRRSAAVFFGQCTALV